MHNVNCKYIMYVVTDIEIAQVVQVRSPDHQSPISLQNKKSLWLNTMIKIWMLLQRSYKF